MPEGPKRRVSHPHRPQSSKEGPEPIPARNTIDRQKQHSPGHQDGGRETDDERIDKFGGDIQRDDVERH